MYSVTRIQNAILEVNKGYNEPFFTPVNLNNSLFILIKKPDSILTVYWHVSSEIYLGNGKIHNPYSGMIAVMIQVIPKELIRSL